MDFYRGKIMKNKLNFLFYSIQQSVVGKPMGFVLLFLVFFATTICCSIPSRWLSAGLNAEYSQSQRISFSISAQDFMQNNVAIGNFIRDNANAIAFDEEGVTSYTYAAQFNVTILANNTKIIFEKLRIYFAITQNYGIAENNIQNKENVVSVRESIALENGIKIGDTINLFGNDLTVINLFDDRGDDFAVPYNIQINEWYSWSHSTDEFAHEPTQYGSVINAKYSAIKLIKNGLKQFNCTFSTSFDYGTMVCVILVISMIAAGMLSSISIMGYWLKCNKQKYAIYKTLGCGPTLLAVAMIIETLLIAILAIGCGLIVDYFIGISMVFEMPLASFTWLHYLLLIGGTLVSATVMVAIAVLRCAIVMPADSKYKV